MRSLSISLISGFAQTVKCSSGQSIGNEDQRSSMALSRTSSISLLPFVFGFLALFQGTVMGRLTHGVRSA